MTNAEWMIKNGYKFKDIQIYKNYTDDESWDYRIEIPKANVNVHVKGADRADTLLRWLAAEYVEPILDDAERRYLSAVIRPFRDDVYAITKKTVCSDGAREYIVISARGVAIIFPSFDKNTMYKGMEVNRHYTLEDLGL